MKNSIQKKFVLLVIYFSFIAFKHTWAMYNSEETPLLTSSTSNTYAKLVKEYNLTNICKDVLILNPISISNNYIHIEILSESYNRYSKLLKMDTSKNNFYIFPSVNILSNFSLYGDFVAISRENGATKIARIYPYPEKEKNKLSLATTDPEFEIISNAWTDAICSSIQNEFSLTRLKSKLACILAQKVPQICNFCSNEKFFAFSNQKFTVIKICEYTDKPKNTLHEIKFDTDTIDGFFLTKNNHLLVSSKCNTENGRSFSLFAMNEENNELKKTKTLNIHDESKYIFSCHEKLQKGNYIVEKTKNGYKVFDKHTLDFICTITISDDYRPILNTQGKRIGMWSDQDSILQIYEIINT
jgi:hypothetical protein